jgi:hypothetical protein
LVSLVAGAAPDDADNPAATGFVMRNLAPFAALVGVPGRWPNASGVVADVSVNAANHSALDSRDGLTTFTDGETHALTARLQFAATERLRIGLQLPWMRHSGGFLDSTIDNWHELFGLNEGIRPKLEQDQLSYVLNRNTAEIYRFDDSASGIGDLQVGITGELGNLARDADAGYWLRIPWRVTLNVKLPTGDADKLTGSGHTDVGLGIGWRSPDDHPGRIRWWLDAGLLFPGDVDIAGLETASSVYYYDGAVTWRVFRRLDLIAQIAGHDGLYSGNVPILSDDSVQLALGGLWHVTRKTALRVGIYEDLMPESAPDFGIEIALLIRR